VPDYSKPKLCIGCNEIKEPKKHFGMNTQTYPDGLQKQCKTCMEEKRQRRKSERELAMDKRPTIHILCRVSTKGQTRGSSLETQEMAIRRHISNVYTTKYFRFEVHKICASAYIGIPKEINRIFKVVRSGDTILVTYVDRLARNLLAFGPKLENLRERGVDIEAVQENLSYATGRLEFLQKVLDAEKEARRNGDRQLLSYMWSQRSGGVST
jgi:hypothetical protein